MDKVYFAIRLFLLLRDLVKLHKNNGKVERIGALFDGRYHSLALWNVALDQSNSTAVYNSEGPFDLDADSGNYNKSANLKHWWQFGRDSGDIGKDYGNGNPVDLMTHAANISAADIVADYPGI